MNRHKARRYRHRHRQKAALKKGDYDDPEEAARRRQRLCDEMDARHKKRGRIIAKSPPPPK